MKTSALLAIAAAALIAGCREFTMPAGPVDPLLTGDWATAPIPSGSYISLSVRAAGGRITGGGVEHRLCCSEDALTIGGDYSPLSGAFSIDVRYAGGATATFAGTVQGADSLVGGWSAGAAAAGVRVVFYRAPEPPCADSAPLLGTYDPAAPGYLVLFHDSVDAAAEAARLAGKYGFTTTDVWTTGVKGFAALLSPGIVAVLRCESSVVLIEHDGVVTTQ